MFLPLKTTFKLIATPWTSPVTHTRSLTTVLQFKIRQQQLLLLQKQNKTHSVKSAILHAHCYFTPVYIVVSLCSFCVCQALLSAIIICVLCFGIILCRFLLLYVSALGVVPLYPAEGFLLSPLCFMSLYVLLAFYILQVFFTHIFKTRQQWLHYFFSWWFQNKKSWHSTASLFQRFNMAHGQHVITTYIGSILKKKPQEALTVKPLTSYFYLFELMLSFSSWV